jgi:hypothetical protein
MFVRAVDALDAAGDRVCAGAVAEKAYGQFAKEPGRSDRRARA